MFLIMTVLYLLLQVADITHLNSDSELIHII